MTDKELKEAIDTIYQGKLAFDLDDELDAEDEIEGIAQFLEDHDLRPPATARQIEECEQFIGRAFSPSYRHFLHIHDGWKGFFISAGIGYLFGTHHYCFDPDARKDFSIMMWADLNAIVGLLDYPHQLYYPENFYRFIDSAEPAPDELKSVRAFVDEYDEAAQGFPEWKHTLIGGETHSRLFLDRNTLGPDGEMEVVLRQGFAELRWRNFYEYLRDEASGY